MISDLLMDRASSIGSDGEPTHSYDFGSIAAGDGNRIYYSRIVN
jgi:hypothetical protein